MKVWTIQTEDMGRVTCRVRDVLAVQEVSSSWYVVIGQYVRAQVSRAEAQTLIGLMEEE